MNILLFLTVLLDFFTIFLFGESSENFIRFMSSFYLCSNVKNCLSKLVLCLWKINKCFIVLLIIFRCSTVKFKIYSLMYFNQWSIIIVISCHIKFSFWCKWFWLLKNRLRIYVLDFLTKWDKFIRWPSLGWQSWWQMRAITKAEELSYVVYDENEENNKYIMMVSIDQNTSLWRCISRC